MTIPTTNISQEDYDEALLENEECFELSPEEAVQETNDQFFKLDKNFLSSDVISRTHPKSDEGKIERDLIRRFTSLLHDVGDAVSSDIDKQDDQLCILLSQIEMLLSPVNESKSTTERLSQNCYASLAFENNILYFLSKIMIENVSNKTFIAAIKCLNNLFSGPRSSDFQGHFTAFEGTIKRLQGFAENDETHKSGHSSTLILTLIHRCCRGNERAKGAFMRCKGFAESLLTILRTSSQRLLLSKYGNDDYFQQKYLWEAASRCLVTLCKYEDNGKQSVGGITVSSAHDHAQTFFRHGAVQIFAKVNKFVQENEGIEGLVSENVSLAIISMQATRVLAINDEIVQAFVAAGTLSILKNALKLYHDSPLLVASAMGVIRNMCGNDEIKSTLTGNGTLQEILVCMRQYVSVAIIQEHGCGALAAMALRKAENAQAIASLGGVNDIILAMKAHEKNILVQRQGALACRNIISRSNHLRDLFLELDAENVLRKAGKYQGSVDEAYAALRDIGCKVEMIKFDGNGKQVKLEMFGDVKPSFNPSFEASNDLIDRVESRAKYAPKLINP